MMETQALFRADIYRVLALAFAHPSSERLAVLQGLLEELTAEEQTERFSPEMQQTLVALQQAIQESSQEQIEGEYHRLFATSVAVPPCESSYGYGDKGTVLLDVSGFYQAFGLDGNRAQEPVDSIGHELEFMSVLALKEALGEHQGLFEAVAVTVEAEQGFLQDHLGRWYTVLAERLLTQSAQPFYQILAQLLTQWIQQDLERFSLHPEPLPSSFVVQENEAISCPFAEKCG
jgi:TorA maturation chaperone TorD